MLSRVADYLVFHQTEQSETVISYSAARLVSSVQAVMATSAGYIIASSCEDIIEDQ